MYAMRCNLIGFAYSLENVVDDIYGEFGFFGTPFEAFRNRVFGAKIGKNVVILAVDVHDADLLEIGDDCVITDAMFATHTFEDRMFKTGPCKVGNGCLLGQGSKCHKHVTMEPGSTLGPRAFVGQHEVVAKDSFFIGFIAFPVEVNPIEIKPKPCPAIAYCHEHKDGYDTETQPLSAAPQIVYVD